MRRLERSTPRVAPGAASTSPVERGGLYLVTGGLGGVGSVFEHLPRVISVPAPERDLHIFPRRVDRAACPAEVEGLALQDLRRSGASK